MELQIKVMPQEVGSLSVSVLQNRLELILGSGRRISFEGDFRDIGVKLITEGEVLPFTNNPTTAEEVGEEESEKSSPLFQQMITLRRQIAAEEGLSPFIIFHDSTLLKMYHALPMDLQELKAIPGVGDAKLTKYGQRFLDVIREYALSGH